MASKRIKGITIEIEGNAKPLINEIKNIEKEVNGATSKLRDIDKLLKFDPKNTELLTQKQKALTDAIDGTKKKLEEEQKALGQLKQGPQTEETIRQQEALEREIVDTQHSLKSLEQEYKNFGSVAVQQTKAAAEQMKAAGQRMQEIGSGITNAGKTMTRYVTAPIVGAGAAAVKTAADFDESMAKVQAISGANAQQMELLRDKAIEMGKETRFSASESAEALSYMGMAGWKTEEMLSGLPGIMHLAAASGEELGTTSDIVTDALTAFGLSAKDAGHFSDVLAAAATNSNTNVAMLGESFKYAAAPAGTLGYTAEDVAIALGLMANNGIKADMAGTSLRNMFQRMAKPTKESAMAIEQLGLALYDDQGKMYSFRDIMGQIRNGFKNVKMSAEDFEAALTDLDSQLEDGSITQAKYDAALEDLTKQAFGAEEAEKARAAAMLGGTRAMSGLLAIANTTEEDFNKLANAIDNSSEKFAKLEDGSVVPLSEALASGQKILEEYNGQAEAMSAIMEGNLNGDLRKLKASLEALGISMGELMIPKIRELVDSLKGFIDKINEMDDSQKEAIINIAGFAAAIGPVLIVIGSLITGIGKLVWAIGTIKGAFAAGGALAGAGEALAGIGSAISGLLGPIALVGAAILVWVHNWDEIKEAGQLFVERTKEHLTAIKEDWIAVSDAIKEYVPAKFNEIKESVTTIIGLLKEGLLYDFNFLTAGIQEKIEFIKGVMEGGWQFIYDTVTQKAQSMFDEVKRVIEEFGSFFSGIVEKAKTWGSDLINNIAEGIGSGVRKVKEKCEEVGNTIRERLHFSEPDVGPLSDFNSWMPDMMKQMAQQINAGVPGVASAIQNVAGTMQGGLQKDYSGQLAGINDSIGRLAGSGNITVPVYIGQTKFAQAVVNANQTTNYRSGGR